MSNIGKFTSLQWNGNSVVNYVLASQSIYSSISYFKIDEFIPWLSDHCTTRFKLEACMILEAKSVAEKSREELESLMWDADSPDKGASIFYEG